MRQFVPLSSFLTAVLACGVASEQEPPDLVLYNASLYTLDSLVPIAQAVAITGDRITFVGSSARARARSGSRTRELDLGGRLVLPGFIDTHVHPVSGGIELGECNLNEVPSLDELRRVVTECGRANPSAPWVRGGGFQLPLFPNGNPSRQLLDSLIPDRPAFLSSADGHSGWVNSRALELAGVTQATHDPVNGRIERDRTGAPSGALRESAQRLVSRLLPAYTDADYLAGLERAMRMANRFGITAWHEASAGEGAVRAYHAADSLGRLTVRSVVGLTVNVEQGAEQVARLDSLRRRYQTPNVRLASAKIFVDGVIEAHTGALLAPYLDRPNDRGELNVQPERLNALVHALDSAGFKVHVHAIGDRAIRVTLDAFEQQRARDGGVGPRHIMAHIQLFDPADVPRFAHLGVVASFQPLWAYRDSYMRDLTEPRLGPARSRWLYPIASVAKSGALLAAGSDWSVSSMNPLEAIEVALTRRGPEDSTSAPLYPEEATDLATMVRAYTLGGAVTGDDESRTGSIVVGKLADLIVLSDNLFTIPPERIASAKVLLTFMGGREVYRDSTAFPARR
jgi:hypothetical protein